LINETGSGGFIGGFGLPGSLGGWDLGHLLGGDVVERVKDGWSSRWFNRYMKATRAFVGTEKGSPDRRVALARLRVLQAEYCKKTGEPATVFPMNAELGEQIKAGL
jgi:hypothetical protein